VMWLLGGGFAGSTVHGKWSPLSASVLDSGDVPGLNQAFDVLGELAQKRLGVGSVSGLFPGHSFSPMNLARATAAAPPMVSPPTLPIAGIHPR
jgi:hypothetical protein